MEFFGWNFKNVSSFCYGESEEVRKEFERLDPELEGSGYSADAVFNLSCCEVHYDIIKDETLSTVAENLTFDEAITWLREEKREKEKEYRKKVFTEAAEIAAGLMADAYSVRKYPEETNVFDYTMWIRIEDNSVKYCKHLKTLNCWVEKIDEGEWMDEDTGEIYSDAFVRGENTVK